MKLVNECKIIKLAFIKLEKHILLSIIFPLKFSIKYERKYRIINKLEKNKIKNKNYKITKKKNFH